MTNAVITGGTKGIGRSLCQLFVAAGYNVATCSRNQDDLHLLKEELSHHNAEILVQKADLSKKNEIAAFASFIHESWSHVDILVNNAGIFIPGSILDEADGNLENMMAINLYSVYYLSRHLVPRMAERGSGHIFNICSVASIEAYPNGGSYSISKHALLGFSKCLREELKGKGVKVTSVIPGATWTHSWEGADFPADRLMQAEDVAKTIIGAYQLGPSAVVEEILIRPQLGDL
jgi:short-subunit dehydrogenase